MSGIENLNISKLYIKGDYVFAGATGSFSPIDKLYSNITGGFYYAKISDLINSTSVYDNSTDINTINIYPNPTNDFITISLDPTLKRGIDGNVEKVQIFDVLGIEVGQSSLIVNDSQAGMPNLLKIDVSKLPAGVYFMRIGDKVEKFVKK